MALRSVLAAGLGLSFVAAMGLSACAGGQASTTGASDAATAYDAAGFIRQPTDATTAADAAHDSKPDTGSIAKDATAPDATLPDATFPDAGPDTFSPVCPDFGGTCELDGGGAGTCCGTCVDTTSDPFNCGQCNEECGPTTSCVQGACVVSSCAGSSSTQSYACILPSSSLGTCCGGSCLPIDTSTDPNNCGGCGNICPTGVSCGVSFGAAGCLSADGGVAFCTADAECPAGAGCIGGYCLTKTCGADDEGESCDLDDAAEGLCCDQVCLDATSDDENCGACGTVCMAGTFCSQGECEAIPMCGSVQAGTACPLGPGQTGSCCSASTCTDTSSDPANCAECGLACPTGQSCVEGQCALADGGAGGCENDAGACPTGDLCEGASCLSPSCKSSPDGTICAFGQSMTGAGGTCCGGVCVNVAENPNHCGQCGVACPSGICAGGVFGQCLPPSTSGGCLEPCPSGTSCTGGTCLPASCNGPIGPCAATDGNPGSCCPQGFAFSCSDVTTDPSNCGGCGFACPAGQTCTKGSCSGAVAPCGAGSIGAFCDLEGGTSFLCCAGGGCTDTNTDKNNCGRCSDVCASGEACVDGSCVTLSCGGQLDNVPCLTDGGPSYYDLCCSGTCVDQATDNANCGGCGHACAGAQTCVGGQCGFNVCTAATAGDPCHFDALGDVGECCGLACVETSSDPANCGGCGLTCPSGKTCVQGACN